jgi:hypothetical protein
VADREDVVRWQRPVFLAHRDESYRRALSARKQTKSPENWIIIAPPDDGEVVCDWCSAEVLGEEIPLYFVSGEMRAAICENCVLKWDERRKEEYVKRAI